MAIFEVLNVGQGDSIIVRPPSGCNFNEEVIMVDLGPGNYDVTEQIDEAEEVHIFLTHHDNDHLGGLRFFAGKMEQVKELIVPLYQNEITLIARAILNLKGIRSSRDCNEFIRALEEIVNNQVFIKSLEIGGEACPRLSFAYQGKAFCNHIECLNPPMLVESYNWIGEMEEESLVRLMDDVFSEPFAREMKRYIRENMNGYYRFGRLDVPDSDRFWLYTQENEDGETNRAKCNYVLDFIIKNMELFRKFNEKSTREHLRKIYSTYVKCTHDVCTVIKTRFAGETMLLTGDASKKVFHRLIREGNDLSASYLKMPHHGSKHNMNRKILDKINPKVAIISHDNGHFGKAKDTHPNQEILDLLLRKHIKILITNDVVKKDATVMKKENHDKDSYVNIQ